MRFIANIGSNSVIGFYMINWHKVGMELKSL